MAQAIVDPEEMIRFSEYLQAYSLNMYTETARLQSRFRQLGDTWRDAEYHRFSGEIDTAMRAVDQLTRACEEYVSFLRRKAEAAFEYQQRR